MVQRRRTTKALREGRCVVRRAAAGGVSVWIQGSGDKTMLQKELCYFFSVKCLLRHNSPRKPNQKGTLQERPVRQLTGIILVAFKALISAGI